MTDSERAVRQHKGWLKMYVEDMRLENFRDMKTKIIFQLNALEDEIYEILDKRRKSQ